MTDLAVLISSIAGLITAIGGAAVAIAMAMRMTRRESAQGAHRAARVVTIEERQQQHAGMGESIGDGDGW